MSLADQIADALRADARVDGTRLFGLRQSAKEEVATIAEQADAAERDSLDPSQPEADAEAAADKATALRRREQRLQAAITALAQREKQVEQSVADAARRERYAAAKLERDALVAELREVYPAAAAVIADVLRRVVENDAELRRVNAALPSGSEHLAGADAVARSLKHHETHASLTTSVRLPSVNRDDVLHGRAIWPPPSR